MGVSAVQHLFCEQFARTRKSENVRARDARMQKQKQS